MILSIPGYSRLRGKLTRFLKKSHSPSIFIGLSRSYICERYLFSIECLFDNSILGSPRESSFPKLFEISKLLILPPDNLTGSPTNIIYTHTNTRFCYQRVYEGVMIQPLLKNFEYTPRAFIPE